MRDHPVPCVNASPSQVMRGHHFTYADDRVCTRCRPSSTAFGREAGGRHGMARLPAGPTESIMPDLSDPDIADAVRTARALARGIRDNIEDEMARMDALVEVLDRLDDLATVRLRAVR